MSLSLGIYDVFSYAIPGSLYLALGAYIVGRLHLAEVTKLAHGPTVLVVGGIIVASYLLGFVTYPLASAIEGLLRFHKSSEDARGDFLLRCPAAQDRPYAQADMRLLQAAAEVLGPDVSQEILRLRAVGIMTRNCAIPLLLTCITAAVSAIAGTRISLSLVVAFLCAAAAAAAVWQARRFRHWSHLKTLEICYWIPEIDSRLAKSFSAPTTRNAVRRRPATAIPPVLPQALPGQSTPRRAPTPGTAPESGP
jgi:hypothetical protein